MTSRPIIPRAKGSDLGVLQGQAEQAASRLKAANTAVTNAVQAQQKAEAAYAVAQKSLVAGVAQVQAATKV